MVDVERHLARSSSPFFVVPGFLFFFGRLDKLQKGVRVSAVKDLTEDGNT